MADEILKLDENHRQVLGGITDDANQNIRMLRVDPATGRLKVSVSGISVAATVAVGTTTTLTPGAAATVVNSGTISAAVLDFGIPPGSVIYSSVGIPLNTVGVNGDWAFDTSINAEVYYKSGGAWALVNDLRGPQGIQGVVGPVGMTWQGNYNNLTAYALNDAVFYATTGSSYINIQAGTGNLPTNAAFWNLLAQKGADGIGSGDVMGPATNTDSYIPQWNGTDTKTLKNGLAVPAGGLAGLTAVNEIGAKFTDTANPTGFLIISDGVDVADTTMAFNTTSKVFTLAKVNATFSFYSGNQKWTKSADQTVDLTSIWANNTLIYVSEDASGELAVSLTEWDLSDAIAPVATVLWNGASTFSIIGDERHGAKRNNAWHEWAHDTIGTKYLSGFDITTLNSTSTIITSGQIIDEDIHLSVGTQTDSIRLAYATGSTLTYDDTLSATTAKIIAGALQYDLAGTLTPVTSGYFIRSTILASNVLNAGGPVVTRIATSEWDNINSARNSPPPSATTYLSNETRQLYSVIWQNLGGTPTLVEYTDYRQSPTLPNGFVAKTPIWLDTVQDVATPSPQTGDFLQWNGLNWINAPAGAVSAGKGISFYNATPVINAITPPAGLNSTGASGNGIQVNTLSVTPVTTAEQTVTGLANNDTRTYAAWLYGTALGRTKIEAGSWDFITFLSVTSVTGTCTNTRQIYQVVPASSGTVTTTNLGANSKTATITSSQFAGTYFAASATNTVASFLQTPAGIFQISANASVNSATIIVPTGYANETTVAFKIWNVLVTSGALTLTATGATQYNQTVVGTEKTIAVTDMLGQMSFFNSNNNKTITLYYNGTLRNSFFRTPLAILHNDLAGLQGGSATERYHMTAAEATVVGNTSGTNTGDNSANTSSVAKSLYDANTILYATTDDTPVALTVGTNTVVGRINGGITTLAVDSDLSSTSAGDDSVPSAKATKAMGDLKLPLAGGTMTGDILGAVSYGATGTRVTKVWATNLETTNEPTVGGNQTKLLLAGGTMTGNIVMGDAKQVVLTVPSADVTCTGFSTSGFVSGYTSSAVGDLVYLDANAKWQKVDADAIATAGGMLGIALAVAATDASLLVALPGSFVRVNAWNWTVGNTLYAGETAGAMQNTIPTGADGVIRVVGWACNADYIYFYPSQDNSTVVA